MKQLCISFLSIFLMTIILGDDDSILLKKWTFNNKDEYKKTFFCYPIDDDCKISSEYDLEESYPLGTGVFKVKIIKTNLQSLTNIQFLMVYDKGLLEGKFYRVTLAVKTDNPCELGVNIQKANTPWTVFAEKNITTKKGEWEHFSYDFKAATSFDGKIFGPGIFLGKVPAGTTLEFAMVKLEQIK